MKNAGVQKTENSLGDSRMRLQSNEPLRFRNCFDESALLCDMSVSCLTRIAENNSVPASLLEQLALHPHPAVREAVADNVATPGDTLCLLAYDSCPDVRYAMAENHNLPFSILAALCDDENPYIADRARRTLARIGSTALLSVEFGSSNEKVG